MNNQTSNNSVYDITIIMLILLMIIAWCLMIMYPFAGIILWSLILAIALQPFHFRLTKKFGGKPKLASFIIIFSILAIVILPLLLIFGSLADEVKELKVFYDNGTLSIPPPTERVKEWPFIGEKFYETWQSASVNIEHIIIKYKDTLLEIGSKIGRGILSAVGGVIQFVISLVIAGVLLVIGGIGESVRKFFRKAGGSKGDEYADLVVKTVRNVVKGVIGEALVIAILHGIVFVLAGIPYPGIWTLLIFVLAILQMPVLIVTVPIMIYFFAVKETMPAIIWSISVLLVSLSDNFLTPIMLGKRSLVPMLVMYIGVIGGFVLSGVIGLFTGAIVMSVGYKLFVAWINSSDAVAAE